MKNEIRLFKGEYGFLSNFWICNLEVWGRRFPSSEHAYVYSKNPSQVSDNWDEFVDMMPVDVKRYGRQLTFTAEWEDKKIDIMTTIVTVKFIQNINLQRLLVQTGDAALIEGNTWGDKFWGIDERSGEGRNVLGNILMSVRDSLKTPGGSSIKSEPQDPTPWPWPWSTLAYHK